MEEPETPIRTTSRRSKRVLSVSNDATTAGASAGGSTSTSSQPSKKAKTAARKGTGRAKTTTVAPTNRADESDSSPATGSASSWTTGSNANHSTEQLYDESDEDAESLSDESPRTSNAGASIHTDDAGQPLSRWHSEMFSQILRLTQLPNAEVLERYVSDDGSFDPLALVGDIWPHSHDYAKEIKGHGEAQDALTLAFLHINDLDSRLQKCSVQWLYATLGLFELVKDMFPNTRGYRLGPVMGQELLKNLGDVICKDTGLSMDQIEGKLRRWYLVGKKLKAITKHLAPGSLFFLTSILNPNV